jgi:hypothetical protein
VGVEQHHLNIGDAKARQRFGDLKKRSRSTDDLRDSCRVELPVVHQAGDGERDGHHRVAERVVVSLRQALGDKAQKDVRAA